MAKSRAEFRGGCKNAFGEAVATEAFARQAAEKLVSLGVRLGQVSWIGPVGKGATRAVQVVAKITEGTSVRKRTLRLTQNLDVIHDETAPAENTLGFRQQLDTQGDPFRARRDMGDT